MRFSRLTHACIGGALLAASVPAAAATLTLTQAGINDGFGLTVFATVDPGRNDNKGPFGTAVTSDGHVLSSNYIDNTRYVWPDADGQTTGSALHAISPSDSSAIAYATAGGKVYGGVNGAFVQFKSDGTVDHILTGVAPYAPWFGMWGNPVNGHILATTAQGDIIDIDPNASGGAGSATKVVHTGTLYDGVSVSPDGNTVYAELNGRIEAWQIATGTKVFQSSLLNGGPDGVGVISSANSLNGQIIVNFNGPAIDAGFVGLLDPATNVLTKIADGGTRGDYVAADPTNGTLLLVYSDVIYRLSCGSNCAIGQTFTPTPPTGAAAPEPGTLWVAGVGTIALVVLRARSRRRGAARDRG